MRLSRPHFVPALAIVAGGVIGASLSFSFLGSRSGEVPGVTLGLLDKPAATPGLLVRIEHPDGMVVTAGSIELNGTVITPVVAPSATAEFYLSEEQKAVARARALTVGTLRWSSDLNGFPVPTANKIEVEEPQRFLWTFGGRQVEFYPPNIEFDPPEIELTRER